jgi:MFS family permease
VFATGGATTNIVLVLMAVIGFSAAGSGTTLYAQIAHLYPPAMRGTGMGVVLGLARLGAVASAYVGSISLDMGGAPAFFVMFAVAVAIGTLACIAIRRPTLPVMPDSRPG